MKQLVHKAMQPQKGKDATSDNQTDTGSVKARLKGISDLNLNEELKEQLLIKDDKERERETKFKNDHVDYLRVAQKPLQFGIEEAFTYTRHNHMQIQGCLQNCNNE